MRKKRSRKTIGKLIFKYRKCIMMFVLLIMCFCLGIYKYENQQQNLKVKSQSIKGI